MCGFAQHQQLIETAAADRWNKPAGYVIKAVLKATMSDQTNLRQHVTGWSLHGIMLKYKANVLTLASAPTSVAMMLPQLSDKERDALAIGFGAKYPSSRNRAAELVSAYCALLAGEDNLHADRAQGVFLENEGGSRGGGSQYRVSLEKVCGRLKRQLLDAVVTEKWGNNAKRLISIIELNGMTSEPKVGV
jgi:DNA-directed RNA polymerase III subunit RPC3